MDSPWNCCTFRNTLHSYRNSQSPGLSAPASSIRYVRQQKQPLQILPARKEAYLSFYPSPLWDIYPENSFRGYCYLLPDAFGLPNIRNSSRTDRYMENKKLSSITFCRCFLISHIPIVAGRISFGYCMVSNQAGMESGSRLNV